MIKNKTNAVVTNILFNLFSTDSIRNLILKGWKSFRFIMKKIKTLNYKVKFIRILLKKVLSQRCYCNKLKLNKVTHSFLEIFCEMDLKNSKICIIYINHSIFNILFFVTSICANSFIKIYDLMTVIYKFTKTIFELKAIYFFTVKNFHTKQI